MLKAILVARQGLPASSPLIKKIKSKLEIVDTSQKADLILVLGGDGTMLTAIKKYYPLHVPFVGFNFGHLGFLLNEAKEDIVDEIISGDFDTVENRLLRAELFSNNKKLPTTLAFNDFYFERSTPQTCRIKIAVNNKTRFEKLVCDGAIVSTPAGSTSYNASAGGKILPIDSRHLVLTAICPALFHNWRSAQLSHNSIITLTALDTERRPVAFMADGQQISNVTKAQISYSTQKVKLLFAHSQDFREKFLRLQFSTL